jgi:hypothetical protein
VYGSFRKFLIVKDYLGFPEIGPVKIRVTNFNFISYYEKCKFYRKSDLVCKEGEKEMIRNPVLSISFIPTVW